MLKKVCVFVMLIAVLLTSSITQLAHAASAPAPLYLDPVTEGPTDPTIIQSHSDGTWWMFYTQRRSNDSSLPAVTSVYGSDIGVAKSTDNGITWTYQGIAQGLAFESGKNTYWAPEVIWSDSDSKYHMYVSYITGSTWTDWSHPASIYHCTSTDLINWTKQAQLPLGGSVIDACVYKKPDGSGWRMWYKNSNHIYAADSADLYNWAVVGPIITDRGQEAPYVFKWKGYYWMLTDPWNGLGVYRADNPLGTWTQRANILATGGTRPYDGATAHHAMVVINGNDDAYIIYTDQPTAEYPDGRRSAVQAAKLTYSNGEITCDRNAAFDLALQSTLNVFNQIEAEDCDSSYGSVRAESCGEGGQNLGYIKTGDYVVYNDVNFGVGATDFKARISGQSTSGKIELRLDSPTGTLIGTLNGVNTGGWQTYTTATCNISGASGVHNLYMVFTAGLNLNWFQFTPAIVSGGTYKIIARHSGKAMEVLNSSTADGASVVQSTYSGANSQLWQIADAGGGYYKIVNKNSGKVADVSGGSTADGAQVIQSTYSGANSQIWQIVDVGGGYYKLVNKNSGKVADVSGASTADGAKVIQWPYSGGNNQRWSIVKVQ